MPVTYIQQIENKQKIGRAVQDQINAMAPVVALRTLILLYRMEHSEFPQYDRKHERFELGKMLRSHRFKSGNVLYAGDLVLCDFQPDFIESSLKTWTVWGPANASCDAAVEINSVERVL